MEEVELLNKIQIYCDDLQQATKERWPDCEDNHHMYKMCFGQKYIKIVCCDLEGNDKRVHCFFDYEGNVYKAASWNRPAEGVRGTIDTVDHKDIYGSRFYK